MCQCASPVQRMKNSRFGNKCNRCRSDRLQRIFHTSQTQQYLSQSSLQESTKGNNQVQRKSTLNKPCILTPPPPPPIVMNHPLYHSYPIRREKNLKNKTTDQHHSRNNETQNVYPMSPNPPPPATTHLKKPNRSIIIALSHHHRCHRSQP